MFVLTKVNIQTVFPGEGAPPPFISTIVVQGAKEHFRVSGFRV